MSSIIGIIKQETMKTPLRLLDATDLWLQWYIGDVKSFHTYKVFNGLKDVTSRRQTLNMPKKICEDWANLLLNEKTDVKYGDEEGQAQLQKMLNNVEFWQKGNEGIEKTFALGNGAFVESVDDKGNERLQFVNAKKIYPITIEQDKVTECAFVNLNSNTTIIQIHTKDEKGLYVIKTLTYEKQPDDKSDTIGVEKSRYIFETNSDIAWYQMIKPNVANNLDINSPLGISIFANALDTLEGVDLAYDGMCQEMRLGRSRVFANTRLMQFIEGEEKPVFDANDTGIYFYGNGEDVEKEPLKFYNPPLRTEQYFNGINSTLNLLSSKVGFGENHYRFDKGGIATATQVISENSEMFRTLKKHEILLNDVITNVCKALMYIHNEFTGKEYKFDLDAELEVKFDDSIIEDKETQKANDRSDVNLGVMSKAEYRSKWFNEDIETATTNINDIKAQRETEIGNFFSEE